jgi:hypothetical protein
VQQLAVSIDFNDSPRPTLGDHHAPIAQRLNGMDLDALSGVAVGGTGVVRPNNLPRFAIDLNNFVRALRNKEVTVRQNMQIVDTVPRSFPFDLSVLINNDELAISLRGKFVLGEGGRGKQVMNNYRANECELGSRAMHWKPQVDETILS